MTSIRLSSFLRMSFAFSPLGCSSSAFFTTPKYSYVISVGNQFCDLLVALNQTALLLHVTCKFMPLDIFLMSNMLSSHLTFAQHYASATAVRGSVRAMHKTCLLTVNQCQCEHSNSLRCGRVGALCRKWSSSGHHLLHYTE